jgi:hypothetical protein
LTYSISIVAKETFPEAKACGVKSNDFLSGAVVQELFRDPVVCTDGFSYERAAAVTWLENNDTSFVTGDRLTSQHVVPNLALRSRLRDMQPTPIESADRGK